MHPVQQSPGDSIRTSTFIRIYSDGTRSKETREELVSAKQLASSAVPTVMVHKNVELDDASFWSLVWLVFAQVVFVTMVYGPIAAFLVEMFPVKIRYTSMSLPYHIGNGIFGGLLPAIATFLATRAAQVNDAAAKAGAELPYDRPYLEGLWYPIIIAGVSLVIGVLYIDGNDNRIDD